MKFYESHYEDYYQSVEKNNFHPELLREYDHFPKQLIEFKNTIIYGPPGVGKYSQMLYFLHKYSPSLLKYEKKITAQIEKQTYIYKISDIHYEIDMSLLGCNSKNLWHEIYQQIVDIVSVNPQKHAIIVCKNFHTIHNELLEIFYSYIQQYCNSIIKIKFILITEHLSFLPNNIIDNCYLLYVKRPDQQMLIDGFRLNNFVSRNPPVSSLSFLDTNLKVESINLTFPSTDTNSDPKFSILLPIKNIHNLKEIYLLHKIKSISDLPVDNFNNIGDTLIEEMKQHKKIYSTWCHQIPNISKLRDQIYDMLIYDIDVYECVWYIFSYFVQQDSFTIIDPLLEKMALFCKQFGNNYRAIFHIENILFAMICAFHT